LPIVEAVVTDPPWRASNGSRILRKPGDGLGVAPSRLSTSLEYGSIGVFEKDIIEMLPSITSADVLVLCGYMELGEVIAALSPIRSVFVWHNSRPTPLPGVIAYRDVAFIVWGGRSTLAGKNGRRWESLLFKFPSPQAGCMATERILNSDGTTAHPAQEPIGLFHALLQPLGQVILDPYMGSGTTLRAAKDLGRQAIGIEIEEKYCEIAARRLAQEVLPL